MKLHQTEWHIPVNLLFHVVLHHLEKEFKLYLLLKSRCDGFIELDQKTIDDILLELNVCQKTFTKQLKKLIKLNWIGQFNSNKSLNIRSFERVCKYYNLYSKSSIVFRVDFFMYFKGFIGGAIFTHFYYASKRGSRRRDAAKMGTAQAPARDRSFGYPVAITGVSKCLSISPSVIYRLKQAAIKAGFIAARSAKLQLDVSAGFISAVSKINMFKTPGAIYAYRSKLFQRLPDLISTTLKKSHRHH